LEHNYYQLLEIGVRSTQAEIKAAYKKLALKYHPDVNQGSIEHEEKFKLILEAYQTLSDPARKDTYDMKLFYKAVGKSASGFTSGPDSAYRNVPRTRREKEDEEYKRRKSQREDYREFKGTGNLRKIDIHTVAVGLLVLGTFIMISIWFGNMMNHWTAKNHLEKGDFVTALQFDDEYGEAYYARYLALKENQASPKVLLQDINLAIRFSNEPKTNWMLDRAMLLLALDSVEACRNALLDLRNSYPKNDTVCVRLGEFFGLKMKEPKKALCYFDSALAIRSSYPALLGRAESLYKLKRFSQAIPAFSECIKLNSSERILFFYRGSVHLALGDIQSACMDLNQALNMGSMEAKPLVDGFCNQPAE
jgi:tetratricopeptide (TPR) repeat protein